MSLPQSLPSVYFKLTNVLDKDVVEKSVYIYDKMVSKVDSLESKIASTVGFTYTSQYHTDNKI